VHLPTWVHPAFCDLYNAYFPSWGHEPELLIQADQLPNDKVRAAHNVAKRDLIELVARNCNTRMSPDRPIVGYARRMTSYKRPELIFSDIERLRRINGRYPFQLVLSGKAHPNDQPGMAHIQAIHRHIDTLKGEMPVAFLPNYDLDVARTLVPGVDVWLNTPVPPMEASGTSGMKAALNGGLNLSVLDGWWIEAWIEGVTGWAIGSDANRGAAEATADDLYGKLEDVVLPLYYGNQDGWVTMMKSAISKIACYFNTQRMMRRYAAEAYVR
jgi:starch phosphorylase